LAAVTAHCITGTNRAATVTAPSPSDTTHLRNPVPPASEVGSVWSECDTESSRNALPKCPTIHRPRRVGPGRPRKGEETPREARDLQERATAIKDGGHALARSPEDPADGQGEKTLLCLSSQIFEFLSGSFSSVFQLMQ
jgi:hypothetical protein